MLAGKRRQVRCEVPGGQAGGLLQCGEPDLLVDEQACHDGKPGRRRERRVKTVGRHAVRCHLRSQDFGAKTWYRPCRKQASPIARKMPQSPKATGAKEKA